MVSLRQTSLKYRGKKALTYDAVRQKQARWTFENKVVGGWLDILKPSNVLDCPVGTGRFFFDYDLINTAVTGIDISGEMLLLAAQKISRSRADRTWLFQGDATATRAVDRWFDCVVCVRFLDLIDEDAMRAVVKELCRVARKNVIFTIRFGDTYVPKSNTAEHDRKKFMALIRRCGFRVASKAQFRQGSWHLLLLERV